MSNHKNNRQSIILNICFWLLMILLTIIGVVNSPSHRSLLDKFTVIGVFGGINVGLFYTNYMVLIPELIKKKQKYFWYIIALILSIAICTILKYAFALFYPDQTLRYVTDNGKIIDIKVTVFIVSNVFIAGFFLVSSSIIKFTVYWYQNEKTQRALEQEKREMELQFLKSQLNPHFLFNSLNNIYALAYKKSEKTADAILKLSEIMRYMIYESNDAWVTLDKEVAYLENFVELQRIRFKDGAAVEMNLNGELDGQKIVPLILISFVENAFKHGVANDPKDPIRINLNANKIVLRFSVTNKKNKNNKDMIGGVGLSNVERRLQLLYPERYKLNIQNTETHYTTELILDL